MKQLIKSTIKYIQKLKDKTNDGIEEIVYYHLEETIKKYKPVLIIEFHNTKKLTRKYGYELVEQEKFLQELGYEFVCNINKVDRVYVPVCINNLQYWQQR